MATRANIILKDGKEKLIFYKHWDGYPEGTLPLLNEFLDNVKSGVYRDNIMQCAGHLILLGRKNMLSELNPIQTGYNWKVGDIEPTTRIHEDIDYKYTIDLVKKTITVKKN